MKFDTKIKIALRDDLEPWQELNVTAFLMSGIAGTQKIIGEPYVDADGEQYLPMSQQPIMIHSASAEQLQHLIQKGLTKDVVISIYTHELFTTYNDEDNRATIAKFKTADLDLVGVTMRGKKTHVDKLFKGIALHK
ncbi:DUF2000 family protein [Pediococcus siamensis]|uniref:DUF2000 family protein n=1 Tax=Pediococcus siamensis TaxID=381829 RepID=UPI00399F46F4